MATTGIAAKLKTQTIGQIIAAAVGIIICAILFKAFTTNSASILINKGLEKLMLIVRVVHIVAGCLTLFTGLGAILSRKGGKVHVTQGKIYFWNMAIIFITGIMMAFYTNNMFFFFIGFVSFYPAFVGSRILKQKRLYEGEKAKWYDKTINYLVVLVAFYGIYLGVKNIETEVGILLIIFNCLLLRNTYQTFKTYRQPPKLKGFWLIVHISEMSGSFIAAITAFLVNNSQYFSGVNQILLWTSPGIIGGIIIYIVSKKVKSKLA
jgi:hypothetical protein